MNKLAFILLFTLLSSFVPLTVSAQSCTPACTGNMVCFEGACIDPASVSTGDVLYSGATQGPTITAASGGSGATQSSGGSASTVGGGDLPFVPLTGLPGLQQIATQDSFSGFLNTLYKLCIGIAAAIAVLKLIQAGVMYMGGDSFTNKEEAKGIMRDSIFGLILVLSPVIVFGLINPRILKLQLSTTNLQSTGTSGSSSGDAGATPDTILFTDSTSSYAAAKARCDSMNGVAVPVCGSPSGSGEARPVTDPSQCKTGEKVSTICTKKSEAAATSGQCPVFKNGNTTITQEQAGCCANQDGCSAQIGGGFSSLTCTCGSAAAPVAAVTYGWQARYKVSSTPGASSITLQKGGFKTQAACYASSSNDVPAGHIFIDPPGFICTCDKPLQQQSSSACVGLR